MSDGKIPRSRQDLEARLHSRAATVAEVRSWITAGVAVGAKNIYDQLSEESIKNFERLEDQVVLRVLTELENRSWRRRIHLRWAIIRERLRGYLVEMGVADPMERRPDIKLEPPMPPKTEADFAPEVERALPKAD